jgi:hypothetical protein
MHFRQKIKYYVTNASNRQNQCNFGTISMLIKTAVP